MARSRYQLQPGPAVPRTLGQRLRAIRKAWDLRQGEMAQRLGVDQTSISKWERDILVPSELALIAMCAVLRMDREALVTGRDFAIPDFPGYSGKTSKAAEPRAEPLPSPARKGRIRFVDRDTESHPELTSARAWVALEEALKQGRAVWVVVD